MTRYRAAVVALGLCAAFGLSSASASLMPVASRRLAAGSGAVPRCDVDGVTVSYTNAFDTVAADYRTTAVTVANINTACAGMVLKVTVRAATGVSLFGGSATVPAAPATSLTISTPPLTSSSVGGWAVAVTG